MSRGPGVWQRAILDRIQTTGAVILTSPDQSHSDQNSIRRAAKKLEEAGLVQIAVSRVEGRARLVAVRPGISIPSSREVTGLDGKTYRYPVR